MISYLRMIKKKKPKTQHNRTREIAQCIKVPAAKSDHLSSTPGIHVVKGEKFPVSCSLTSTCSIISLPGSATWLRGWGSLLPEALCKVNTPGHHLPCSIPSQNLASEAVSQRLWPGGKLSIRTENSNTAERNLTGTLNNRDVRVCHLEGVGGSRG